MDELKTALEKLGFNVTEKPDSGYTRCLFLDGGKASDADLEFNYSEEYGYSIYVKGEGYTRIQAKK